jgi:hypothetical protein
MKKEIYFNILIMATLVLTIVGFVIAEDNATGGPIQYGQCGDSVCDNGENTSSYPYYCPQDCNITIPNPTPNATTNDTDVDNKTKPWSGRCSGFNHRLDGKIKAYEDGRKRHALGLFNILEVVKRIEQRAKADNVDTTQLDSDLILLNQSIEKFKADYALFIQKLKDTKNYTCGHSQGQYVNALSEAKAQLRIAQDDMEVIKNLTKIVIQEDIKSLREGIRNQTMQKVEKRLGDIKNKTQEKIDDLEERQNTIRERADKIINRTNSRIGERK